MKNTVLAHDYLLSRITYSPITGVFRWKKIAKNMKFSGRVAGTRTVAGIVISINGEKWTASRLAVFYMTGKNTFKRVRHLNGNPLDCRYENLVICGESK